jgi:hypothetical protein
MLRLEAEWRQVWTVDAAIGKVTTQMVAQGTVLSSANSLEGESTGGGRQHDALEVVSFEAIVDERLGGPLRPGAFVALYGFGAGEGRRPIMQLIQDRLWVVDVQPVAGAPPQPTITVTVAAAPDDAPRIIETLGTGGLHAWLTVATAIGATATPAVSPPHHPGK